MQQTDITTNKRIHVRVPASAVTFINNLDAIPGSIKDISASGLRLEIQDTSERRRTNLNIGIPLLHNQEISGKIRWHKKIEGNDGNVQYGIEFINLTDSQKRAIRKTILIDEPSLFQFTEEISKETCAPDVREKIKVFFLIEVKTMLERLIEINCARETEMSHSHDSEYAEILHTLREETKKLGTSLSDTALFNKIDQKVEKLLSNLIKPENNYNSIYIKPQLKNLF